MNRNTKARPVAPMHALHHALDALARGDADAALRHAIPALADADAKGPAADIVGRALAAAGDKTLATDAHRRALPWLVRRGYAPHAVACALALRALGGKDDALATVAAAFSSSARPGNEVAPPALNASEIVPLDASIARAALIDTAKKALGALDAPTGSAPERPHAPLWGALPKAAFERFAKALEVRVVPGGKKLMSEGEPGNSAFVVARGELRVSRGAVGDEVELAVLGAGSIVGEMALVTEAPRAATVTATRGALVLEASRTVIDDAAREIPAIGEQVIAFCHRRLVDNVLRTSSLLREVPASEREGLAQLFETHTFEPGQALIAEAQNGAGLHLIAAGAVEVARTDDHGDVLKIASLGPGSCVGEISLVMRRPATAAVIAVQPTVSLVLPAERFMSIVKSRPNLLARLYELAVQREDETLTVLGQEAEDADDLVMV
jgi:cAMP-dependent protein kinase regulator